MRTRFKAQKGNLLIGVIFLVALSLITASGILTAAQISTRTRATVNKQSDYYYDAETVLNSVVAWMQDNSESLVFPFTSANFSSNFDLGSPTVGDNEGAFFSTPTLIKMKGTSQSVLLSTDDSFGQPAFPSTQHITNGTSFDAVTAFRNADFGGESNARIVLVWARHTNGSYEPVFRVDVITGNNPDRGVHSFSYVYSSLVSSTPGAGFYGKTAFATGSPNNICSSYVYTWNGTSWSRGAPRSNCFVASDQTLELKSIINGDAGTLLDDGIVYRPPSGSVTGDACDGAGCHSLSLPTFGSWDSVCGGANQGDVTVSSNQTWTVSNGNMATSCWRDVTVNNNRTLTLNPTNDSNDGSTANYAFYFRTLDLKGNLAFPTMAPNQKVTIYVEQWDNNHFNGNQVLNLNNAPYQVVINYTGSNELTLNGTAIMQNYIRAPYATVTVNGNFNYYGSIHALNLQVIGNAVFAYDETEAGTPVLSDIRFGLRKASQRYR
ncbi:MAG: hypothetical protein J5J00_08415 [Deltaproteobacteria bacterium]|nr:hypothetical protein [Deltaproteobacteria bacterium]